MFHTPLIGLQPPGPDCAAVPAALTNSFACKTEEIHFCLKYFFVDRKSSNSFFAWRHQAIILTDDDFY